MSLFQRIFGKSAEPTEEEPPAPAARAASSKNARPKKPHNLSALEVKAFLEENPHVVLDMWAAWCRPCRAMAPVVEATAGEFSGKVAFAKVNIERDPSLAEKWEVRSIPTLLFFRDGELVRRHSGLLTAQALSRTVRRTFKV